MLRVSGCEVRLLDLCGRFHRKLQIRWHKGWVNVHIQECGKEFEWVGGVKRGDKAMRTGSSADRLAVAVERYSVSSTTEQCAQMAADVGAPGLKSLRQVNFEDFGTGALV